LERAAIVGPGRVGTALALHELQDVRGATGGSPQRQERFCDVTGLPVWEDEVALCRAADWIFLTVPDSQVAALSETLAAKGAFRKGQIVCHTSGVLVAEVLSAAAAAGAQVVSIHPVQSIARPESGRDAFAGATCTVQGDEEVSERAISLARQLGMTPVRIDAKRKASLHAAAALASNALVGLLAVASEAAAGLNASATERDAALRQLLPLAQGTLRNVEAVGLPAALTGAVERGDVGTVALHLQALQGQSAEIYQAFLPVLTRLAAEKGSPGGGHVEDFYRLLSEVSKRWQRE
jgi:predicted short-subunit dehydrogenase-like oxidoreductase (DUF2520 family)